MLARLQRRHRRFLVLIPHRGDADRLDLGIGQHFRVIGETLFHAEPVADLGEAGFGPGAETRDLHLGNGRERLAVFLAEPAETDDTVLHLLHGGASMPSARTTKKQNPSGAAP